MSLDGYIATTDEGEDGIIYTVSSEDESISIQKIVSQIEIEDGEKHKMSTMDKPNYLSTTPISAKLNARAKIRVAVPEKSKKTSINFCISIDGELANDEL